jgi:ABC-type bacteriocin/lantibiotic exporter with double-glycine peptidase domain
MKAGAGGNWKRFDERFDETIVKQTDLSCVSAVGEMLLQKRGVFVSQDKIRDIIGVPSYFAALAKCLNQFDFSGDGEFWKGFPTDENSFLRLLKKQSVGVILIEPNHLGHAVVVEKLTRSDLFHIKDLFDQTAYLMRKADFWNYWSGFVIARLRQ